MYARALEEVAEDLRRKGLRAIEGAILAVVMGALVPAAWLLSARLALALGVAAAVQGALAAGAFLGRRFQIEELALEPAAYEIPQVRAFGARLAGPRQRKLLAKGILVLVTDPFRPGRLYLGDRVARYARELEAIARDICSPAVRVEPVSLARCRWLLTRAADSPLYNPNLPAEDLGSALRRIRAGIRPL